MSTLYTDIDPFCCEILKARVADGGLPPGDVLCADIRTLKAETLAPYRHVHLFCGIGGSPLGLKWAGWPHDWSIVTGGFPCQDVAVGGSGLGVERGSRSGLWREMARVIDTVRPDWIIAENSPALRTRGADSVIDDLERMDYAVTPVVVGARHLGSSHRRPRAWVVGHANRVGQSTEVHRRQLQSQVRKVQGDSAVGAMHADWPPRPGHVDRLPKATNGLPRGLAGFTRQCALHALGNSQVPQVVEVIARAMIATELEMARCA